MSWQRVRARVCLCCGYDLAQVRPFGGGYRLLCDIELGGCGALGPVRPTEAEAVDGWNRMTIQAAALSAAAVRRSYAIRRFA